MERSWIWRRLEEYNKTYQVGFVLVIQKPLDKILHHIVTWTNEIGCRVICNPTTFCFVVFHVNRVPNSVIFVLRLSSLEVSLIYIEKSRISTIASNHASLRRCRLVNHACTHVTELLLISSEPSETGAIRVTQGNIADTQANRLLLREKPVWLKKLKRVMASDV